MSTAPPEATPPHGIPRARTLALTLAALVAFAANSVLCRLALAAGSIDAASFTALRIVAGALVLALLAGVLRGGGAWRAGSWLSAAWLFAYAIAFSFAYLSLDAGTGALLLFGAVQASMLLAGLMAGERPRPLQWAGMALALGGLVYLLRPGLGAPGPGGAAAMVLAGVAWGLYSLRGRGSRDAVAETAGNFLRAAVPALLVLPLALPQLAVTWHGAAYAVASGALASGLGYVVWYVALRGLSASGAATAQLAVPVIAAAGGVLLLDEAMTLRLALAALLILGGIGMTLAARARG
ncbi:MAG TPA: DMT family transporter [Xanthomonadaceae bacterium]|nr:DMT family transporter [Xanthomonadaceae bacterium]